MPDLKSLRENIQKEMALGSERVSIIKLVDMFVSYAVQAQASDVHIEPTETETRIRYRIDGLLYDSFGEVTLKKQLHPEVVSRIKVLSGLRTDEHLLPQDGRFKVRLEGSGGDVDVRVSIIPTYYGENAILRVLAQTQSFALSDLGFAPADLKKMGDAIKKPYGMILANGPTGSGKTTTLYTILKELNKTDVSIITIEDPIEYSLAGTTQIQTNAESGLTFAAGLRSILRQDPNIIMVGEIRDEETASIAVQASLTGHMVLSTLHTNDAATTFPRLLDMGVPSFLIASTVNVAIGQRLVRQLCQECKAPRTLTSAELTSLQEIIPNVTAEMTFYAPKGCLVCNGSGYQGRIAIRELLEVREDIRHLIMNRASAQEIKDAAIKDGMVPMIQDALQKAVKGITSLEEILRVVHE